MKKIFTHIILATIFVLPILVSADQDIGLKNPIAVDSISGLILIVTRVVRYIAIPFIVVAIMYSGYLYIYASFKGNNATDITNAHNSLWYTVIGAFILLSAELIALVMKNTITSLTNN